MSRHGRNIVWIFPGLLLLGFRLQAAPAIPMDLGVSTTAAANTISQGQQTVLTWTLTNAGTTSVVSPIGVTNYLSPGWQYAASTGIGVYDPNTRIWTVPGGLAPGSSAFLSVIVQAFGTGPQTNQVTIIPPLGYGDTYFPNNSATALVTVTASNLPVYSITGSVRGGCQTNSSGMPFVGLSLSGATNLTTLSDTNGAFSFTNLPAGNYTITPSQPGNTFTPASASIALSSNTNLTAFAATLPVIQGLITYDTNGPPIGGLGLALVRLQSDDRIALTDPNGRFLFTNCPPGTYWLYPRITNGFRLSPESQKIVISESNCSVFVSLAGRPQKLQLAALEVTQVIQDWNNAIPLIAGKKTYLRAHLQIDPASSSDYTLLTSARLYNMALPNAPLSLVNRNGALVDTTNAAESRKSWLRTANFELPPEWCTNTLTLKFVCTNFITVTPTNQVAPDSSVTVSFLPVPVVPLKFYAWNWSFAGTNRVVDKATFEDTPGRVVSVLPTPDASRDRACLVPAAPLIVPPRPGGVAGARLSFADWILVYSNSKLAALQSLDSILGGRFGGGGSKWIYTGVLGGPAPTNFGTTLGLAITTYVPDQGLKDNQLVSSSFVSPGFFDIGRQTVGHEIGHCLDLDHDVYLFRGGHRPAVGVCGELADPRTPRYPYFQPVPPPDGPLKPALGPMTNGVDNLIYGLDTHMLRTISAGPYEGYQTEPVVDPFVYFDLMSYCAKAPIDLWPSKSTYNYLRYTITNRFGPQPPPPPPGPPRIVMFSRGFIEPSTGLGGFLPFWSATTTSTNPPPGSLPGTNFLLQVFNTSGGLLNQIAFEPDSLTVEQGVDEVFEQKQFLVAVPVQPDMHEIRILNLESNMLVASITASSNTPSMTSVWITDTNGAAFGGAGPFVVHWAASDADPNDELGFAVQYSADGGVNWECLDLDAPNGSLQIDSGFLPPSGQAMVRVQASDGFNVSEPMNSPAFVVLPHPPNLSMLLPGAGTLFTADQQITFEASVSDVQDGPLNGANIQWISSRDGLLGPGATLCRMASSLAEGRHIISVSATNTSGLSANASVAIVILRQSPPSLWIQTSSNRAVLSWWGSATNFALVSATNLPASQWTPITNQTVAADALQSMTVAATNTARFFRLQLK